MNPMKPDRKQLEADLLQFVQIRGVRHAGVTPLTDLLESGLLDSLLLMDLIFHIEELYGIRFESDHIDPSNFRTISAIVNLVLNQLSVSQRQPD
jgi:acyl carrier protein